MRRKELCYPLNSEVIFEKKRSIRRELLAAMEGTKKEIRKLRIALLSGTTIGQIKEILELFLLDMGIFPEFFVGQYNRFFEESIYGEELTEFKPDIIYIHTNIRNFSAYGFDTKEMYNKLCKVWSACRERFACPVIQNNFEFAKNSTKEERLLVDELNQLLLKVAEEREYLYIQDLYYLSAQFGLCAWTSDFMWYQYKYPFSLEAFPLVCKNLANTIGAILGRQKKLLILDLDNTLWGGVLGECGLENLKLGIESAEGMAYASFQSYIKRLSNEGTILAIASKNEEETVKLGFSHPSTLLKEEDFSIIKANWRDKNTNIAEILKELNILEESAVFIDDNPAECCLVEKSFPAMEVICLEKIEEIVDKLELEGYFYKVSVSEEDRQRNSYYQQNQLRKQNEATFVDYQDYLRSLGMICRMDFLNDKNIERVVQLLNKTNQFNLTGRRYTKEELERYVKEEKVKVFTASLCDQFGDNGLVSVLITEQHGNRLTILGWVMSCRVFKRDLELAVFDELVLYCRKQRINTIEGCFIPTAKNSYVKELYRSLGFYGQSCKGGQVIFEEQSDQEGETPSESMWVYKMPELYENKNKVMEVIRSDER